MLFVPVTSNIESRSVVPRRFPQTASSSVHQTGRRAPEGFIGAGRKRDATYFESDFRDILEAFGERGALVSGCEAGEGHAWEETAFLGVHLCEQFSFIWPYVLRFR